VTCRDPAAAVQIGMGDDDDFAHVPDA
jgi:hypothetical protein